MRNKILIVDADPKERLMFEQILQEITDDGGALFFVGNREDGLKVIAKEQPQLVFLDANLVGENEDEWVKSGVHIIVMCSRDEPQQKSEDFLVKPLKRHQILEKCREVLGKEPAPQIPPM